MPLYEYICNDCHKEFELLVFGDKQPDCPECHSEQLTKKLSVISSPAAGTSNDAGVCDPLPGGG